MKVEEYFERMLALGYFRPALYLWIDTKGKLDGAASYFGTAGYGGKGGAAYADQGELVQALFDHVTRGGQRYVGVQP